VSRVASAIRTRGITKRYADLVAVDHVDLDIPVGTFYGILGPNGAGKTTLLEMVEGIRKPDEGSAEVLGQPVWPRRPRLLPRIGVQLQASAFFERLTVAEQLRTFAALYAVSAARCDEMLEVVGLTDKRSSRTEDLSGGQRQRLSIACALVHDPEVVFLDEPTAALDPQARRNLWDVLRAINDEGRTVVLTTHHMDEAETLCDEVAIMDHGRILISDRPRALVASLGRAQRILVESGQLTEADARALPGVETASEQDGTLSLSTHDPARVLTTLGERQALRGLQVASPTLEDVFLDLTGREYRA
jgi:ABC-2 type transport system ATP-binding protein